MSAADAREGGRRLNKLTTIRVRQERDRGLYGDGGGLFLQVSARATKSWIFRWKEAGKFRSMGLGPVYTVSLAEAREKARDCRKLRLDDRDPIAERKAKRVSARLDAAMAQTFRQCAEHYIAAHSPGWRSSKSKHQWEQSLTDYVYPVFGDFPVQTVDVGLVLKAIEPIWTVKPETAGRVRGRIESVLDWATARGYRAGENPARWRGHLDQLLPKKTKVQQVAHHAALPYRDIGAFIAELRRRSGIAARALEFVILTGTRTGEVLGARWDEIDMAERLWTIPAKRMKAGKEHRVPLSDAALAIVKSMAEIRQGDFVFPGAHRGRSLSGSAMAILLRRMDVGHLTIHGFRATFSDWAAERTNFPSEVREMALAHAVGDKTEAAYRRTDLFQKRRLLAEQWATFCDSPVTSGEVVPIRASAASE
jgi:integrase